ncbi:hypothetical protein CRG98_008353 [Punica granatum]|uniref:Zinc finger PHD-type domain-containing protein n=1 Tax=Punica granatum TaxID=22663 RepID=A0A2I0KSH4_PUNGR|nr:hypothetical protein CRG98_008353 [Punica granatum]
MIRFHACNKTKKPDPILPEGCSNLGPSALTMMENSDVPSDCNWKKRAEPELSGGFPHSRRSSDGVAAYSGPFRDNISQFLEECGEWQGKDACSVGGYPTWRMAVASDTGSFQFSLYAIQENVEESPRSICDSCRCVGWSHHFVSKRRYHLIVPPECEWTEPMGDNMLELNTHLLHGMIHCNGFGHLLCINGKEEGPNPFSASELMDIWDRICTILRVRKVTVHDMSRKESMDLRLLCGVAYGQSWFGKWGYRFCRGSFGVTEDKYDQAIEILCSIDLNEIVQDLSDGCHGKAIQSIVKSYREASDSRLVTISDLLQFMLDSKPKRSRCSKQKTDSLGSTKDNDEKSFAEEDYELVEVSGLLTSFPDTESSRQRWPVIRRRANPRTRTLEFMLQDGPRAIREEKLEVEDCSQDLDVHRDILCLYENVLYGYPEHHPVSLAAQIIFESKHFVKEWPLSDFWDDNDKLMNVLCRAVPSYRELITEFTRPPPPGEHIRIHKCTDITEIKLAAQKAMRDTYFVTDQFIVTDVKVREAGPGVMQVYSVRGIRMDSGTALRYEGGPDNWVVDCVCGARDDDGEKMVACDVCQVWQHTLCNGIEQDEDVPPTFICEKCSDGKKTNIVGTRSGNDKSSVRN